MRGGFVKGVVTGAATSTVVLMAATALAGTGVGGVFNLGRNNSVNATTTLTGATAGKSLQVTNTSTGQGAAGIGISATRLRMAADLGLREVGAVEVDAADAGAIGRLP